MDILDIDSLLNDENFCFTEEKIYDDVTNIIKQWKINNKPNTVFDSRTFTRPKQKLSTNLDPQFKNYMNNEKLGVGGVEALKQQQYFLGDISPPSSKYPSLDLNTSQMLNSLITSADFSNISFLAEEQMIALSTYSQDSLNSKAYLQETFIKNEETVNGNSFNKSGVHSDLSESVFKEKTFIKQVENKQVDSNLDSLINETFNVANSINSSELNKFNKTCTQTPALLKENLSTNTHLPPCLKTPTNNQDQQNIFSQSTPHIENVSNLHFPVSPISLELDNNVQRMCENKEIEEVEENTLEKNTRANNLKKLLNDFEATYNELENKSKSFTNIEEDPIGAIKKRLSGKLEKNLHQNNIILKEYSVFSHPTERLLNKRGRMYDNISSKESNIIDMIENKLSEETNSNVDYSDKAIDVEQHLDPVHRNYRDRFKTMKIKPRVIKKEFCNSNEFSLEKGCNPRFSLVNKNSPQQVVRKNDNIEINKILKGNLQTAFICKTNSASELEHSVFPEEYASLNKVDITNAMGFKAKSFHNLESNNVGYSKNLTISKINTEDRVCSDDKLCSKIPDVSEIRPPSARRTGIVRPSTGIYSKTVIRNIEAPSCKQNKYELEKNCVNTLVSANNFNKSKDVMKYKNDISKKSRLPETLRRNVKETGILRPSSIPKK